MELQRRKKLTEQMFHGMAHIVDRFVVCDLEMTTMNNALQDHGLYG